MLSLNMLPSLEKDQLADFRRENPLEGLSMLTSISWRRFLFLAMMNPSMSLGVEKQERTRARITSFFRERRCLMQSMTGIVEMGTWDRRGHGGIAGRNTGMSLRSVSGFVLKLASSV